MRLRSTPYRRGNSIQPMGRCVSEDDFDDINFKMAEPRPPGGNDIGPLRYSPGFRAG